jgi:uncharacterized protein
MRRLALAAASIVVSLPGAAWGQTVPDQPKILVDGYGEVRTMPDIATIGYNVRGEGATSDDAVRAMTATSARIEASLRRIDATAAPTTDAVRVSPVRSSACKDRDYDSDDDQLSKGACAVVGYVATQSISIRTADVNDAGTLVGLAGRGGAFNARLEAFELNDPRPAKRQAIAAALLDAQTKAAAVAASSRITLGPILTVATTNRDAVRTEDLINNLPQSRAPAAERDEPVPVKLTPEPITTSATVTVTYAIVR